MDTRVTESDKDLMAIVGMTHVVEGNENGVDVDLIEPMPIVAVEEDTSFHPVTPPDVDSRITTTLFLSPPDVSIEHRTCGKDGSDFNGYHMVPTSESSPKLNVGQENGENVSTPSLYSSPNSQASKENGDGCSNNQVDDECLIEAIVARQKEDALAEIASAYEFVADDLITPPPSPRPENGDETCPGAPMRAPTRCKWRNSDVGCSRKLEF